MPFIARIHWIFQIDEKRRIYCDKVNQLCDRISSSDRNRNINNRIKDYVRYFLYQQTQFKLCVYFMWIDDLIFNFQFTNLTFLMNSNENSFAFPQFHNSIVYANHDTHVKLHSFEQTRAKVCVPQRWKRTVDMRWDDLINLVAVHFRSIFSTILTFEFDANANANVQFYWRKNHAQNIPFLIN